MSQRLMCDVDMVEEQQLRQLEGDAAGASGATAQTSETAGSWNRPSQVFAHGAFTHTTAVQSIESGFFYAYDCKGVGTRPRTGSGVLMERSGAEESRWHEVDVKPRRVGTAGRPESAE